MSYLIDEQWKEILEDNAFTEVATITTTKGESFDISGMYISGSYDFGSSASYGAKTWERGDYFQVSPLSLPKDVCKPERDLLNAQLELKDRGVFRVIQIKGANSGMLTLELKPKDWFHV